MQKPNEKDSPERLERRENKAIRVWSATREGYRHLGGQTRVRGDGASVAVKVQSSGTINGLANSTKGSVGIGFFSIREISPFTNATRCASFSSGGSPCISR